MRVIRPLAVSLLTVALSVSAGSCSALKSGAESSKPQTEQSTPATPTPSMPPEQTMMPDVIGMNAEQAIDTVELLGLEVDLDAGRLVLIKKNWTVTASDPAPETMVDLGTTVTLTVEKLSQDDDEALRTTDDGLTQGMAMTVCTRAGEEQFPYGFDVKGFGGHIEVSPESIYLDVEVQVTNESNATRTTSMECTVSGSDERPKLDDFLVY